MLRSGDGLDGGSRHPDLRLVEAPGHGDLVIRRAEVAAGRIVDVRISGGEIAEIEDSLPPNSEAETIDAAGCYLIPGLHDHHAHLRALAAWTKSAKVGPNDVAGWEGLATALRSAASSPSTEDWIRAVGYHESVAGQVTREQLDAIVADRPLRVQHRSGRMWMLNSEAIRRLAVQALDDEGVDRDASGEPTGRLYNLDDWLAEALPAGDLDFAMASHRYAAVGVTGITDATPELSDRDLETLAAARADGTIRQRLHLMRGPSCRNPGVQGVTLGPHKFLLDDTRLPPLGALTDAFRTSHTAGIAVAVHCTTPTQLVLTLAAFNDAGTVSGDRIEHGSLISPELLPELRRLGLIIVTNPGFIRERGDQYRQDLSAEELRDLYRCSSLIEAGVASAAGTDAPFCDPNPWLTIAAAVNRRTLSGEVIGPAERLDPLRALQLFIGRADRPELARPVEVGATADLALLNANRPDVFRNLEHVVTRATIVGGSIIHRIE